MSLAEKKSYFPIMYKYCVIRTIGFVFHSDCFKCCVCNRNLSDQEIPFTADKENRIYCQPDYNE